MKAVCGFKDSRGKFWDKEVDARKSDAEYALQKYKNKHESELVKGYNQSIDEPFMDEESYRHFGYKHYKPTPRALINRMLADPEYWINYAKGLAELKKTYQDLIDIEIYEKKQWWKFW